MTTFTRKSAAVLAVAAAALLAPTPSPAAEERVVEISARRFEFTPATITLQRGQPVVLRLRTQDVAHGFYMKALGIDTTIEPGKVTDVPLTPTAAGRFVTICDHFCGAGHGNMKLTILVE
jgi:cytochrome c oxidase subunit II